MSQDNVRYQIWKVPVCPKPEDPDPYKCDCMDTPNENVGLTVCPIHPERMKHNGVSRTEAVQALYRGFFRAKDRGVYTVKEMLAEGLDELIKESTK